MKAIEAHADNDMAAQTGAPCDWSCVVHLHSTYSDGTPTVPELLEDAAANDRDAVLLTDHDTLGARADGWERWHGSVLLVVGTEISTAGGHLLAFGVERSPDLRRRPGSEAAREVARQGGICFAAHPFSEGSAMSTTIGRPHPWLELEDANLTGIEVWSLITDAAESWRSPREALRFLRQPVAATSRPERSRLERWDQLGRDRRIVGIGGLDAHQSGVRVAGGRIVSPFSNRRFFGSLGTHVLTEGPASGDVATDRTSLLASLAAGRCYLAMDWHTPARGFDFWATSGEQVAVMGQAVEVGLWRLRAALPLPARLILFRDGEAIMTASASSNLDLEVERAGVYRLEAWLRRAGTDVCWIISNPIYLRA